MSNNITKAAVFAVAKIWATMDGKLAPFEAEASGEVGEQHPNFTGHYIGYLAEAANMLEELEAAGFWLLPIDR